jgi:hypothetical membrane protein
LIEEGITMNKYKQRGSVIGLIGFALIGLYVPNGASWLAIGAITIYLVSLVACVYITVKLAITDQVKFQEWYEAISRIKESRPEDPKMIPGRIEYYEYWGVD